MTPLFPVLLFNLKDVSHPEPQKHAIFTDFDSDLRKNGAFWRSKYFLKVVIKLKDLQFTFSALVDPV